MTDNEVYDTTKTTHAAFSDTKGISLFPPLDSYMISPCDVPTSSSPYTYDASSRSPMAIQMPYIQDESSPSSQETRNPSPSVMAQSTLATAGMTTTTNHSNTTMPANSPDGHGMTSMSFNISWGGNDTPPVEVHPAEEELPLMPTKPLPKPRGVRKLPEPEPAEDGTIDEDVLKRRKNTYAARRSRMKKFLNVQNLESRVTHLQSENAKLVLNNAVLESEKKSLLAKEVEYKKRIKQLESIIKGSGSSPASEPSSTTSSETMEAWVIGQ
ncbi:hypothetical protein EC973_002678 [Apophysomyces ossiformis]|uniref:BZIP domain-containing protein n=1 Tax=Apophysomyces ossiformis TaxID=679940 RepID=A0A8H7BKA7_9FUNG|nr:hypothetical protein EC973_002678 [Apophysomyces ossiformis]